MRKMSEIGNAIRKKGYCGRWSEEYAGIEWCGDQNISYVRPNEIDEIRQYGRICGEK
jgi:hypothetical protein